MIQAIGRHLRGVEKLNLGGCRPEIVEALADWTRLRRLCLNGNNLNDERLAHIVRRCPGLQTLGIDEFSHSRVSLSPQGLKSLTGLRGLKRLRLGMCRLTREHLAAIAELERLEKLSLEDAGVTDRTLEPLKTLQCLTRINLDRTAARTPILPTVAARLSRKSASNQRIAAR